MERTQEAMDQKESYLSFRRGFREDEPVFSHKTIQWPRLTTLTIFTMQFPRPLWTWSFQMVGMVGQESTRRDSLLSKRGGCYTFQSYSHSTEEILTLCSSGWVKKCTWLRWSQNKSKTSIEGQLPALIRHYAYFPILYMYYYLFNKDKEKFRNNWDPFSNNPPFVPLDVQ